MQPSHQRAALRIARFLLPMLLGILLPALPARCQDRAGDETMSRGDRGAITVTVRDSSGEPFSGPAMVKLYREGIPSGQGATSKGRAYFLLYVLGDYTVVVDAPGYQTVQKDVSMRAAVKAEVDIVLRPDSASEGNTGVPGKPQLAPKAKEAFEKGLQALNEDKLRDAEKYVGEAMKLAPGHPDVLYVQGVLYLKRHDWTQAQGILEKATQIDPSHARAFAALGMALSDQGKYDAAIAPLERSLQLDAGEWQTQWTLAKAYYHHEQYDAALKTSQEALAESHGAAPEIELLVAQSFTAVGRYEDAAQALRGFLKNHGDQPGAVTARRWLERLTADKKIR